LSYLNRKSPDSYEENREPDISIHDVFDSVLLIFPNIEKTDVKFLYHGTYNVFEVMGTHIFRFPDKIFRNELGIKLIQKEIKILNVIRKFISSSIPAPEYISFDSDNPFVGYKKIKGVSLSSCFQKIPSDVQLKIGEEIGKFLSELHSQDIVREIIDRDILENEFTLESYRNYWETYFGMVQAMIFPLLSGQEKEWIKNLFSRFLDNDANFKFQPVLVHGDFDTSNILINSRTFEITGVIDFEDSRLYDPAADFLFFDEGKDFLNQIISNYKGSLGINFKERQRFLFGRTCLSYIEFGLKNDVKDMILWGLRRLRITKKNLE
jgi:aminoglycoside 2''-phosphotransferase